MGIFILLLASCAKDSATKELSTENVQIETRSGDCKPDPVNCFTNYEVWSITNSLFPGCFFLIGVNVSYCNGSSAVYFSDFEILNHNCPAYTAYINNCKANGTLQSCMNQINVAFQDALAIQGLTQALFQPTGNQVSVYFYFASCSQYCFYESNTGEGGSTILKYTKMPCTDGCCMRTATYRKINGVWTKRSSSTTQVSGQGCEYVLQSPTCPANTLWTTECISECN